MFFESFKRSFRCKLPYVHFINGSMLAPLRVFNFNIVFWKIITVGTLCGCIVQKKTVPVNVIKNDSASLLFIQRVLADWRLNKRSATFSRWPTFIVHYKLHYNIHHLLGLPAFFSHKAHYMAFDRLINGGC